KDGLIIRGAKQLATAAPMTDEVLVFPNGRQFGPGDEAYALCFAVPTDSPGLKIICREPLVRTDDLTLYDHPPSASYEAIEAIIFRAENEPRITDTGTYWPNSDYQTAHGLLFPDFYVTMLEVIKRTSAAGLMLTPTAGDFAGEAGEFAETYFAGAE